MRKTAKSRAEEQFAATQKKNKLALKEKEKARLERTEHAARLRAMRLAKEAADREAADKDEDGKPAAKTKKAPRLHQSHRI